MKKEEAIIYASAGIVGLFLVYYYTKNKKKIFLNQTGGYANPCGGYTIGCKTVPACRDGKIKEIICEIQKDPNEYYNISQRAKSQRITTDTLVRRVAIRKFTNNGKRNVVESLAFWNIKPTGVTERIIIPQHPEIQKIIDDIKGNLLWYGKVKVAAGLAGIKEERQLIIEATKTLRKRNIDKFRQARAEQIAARKAEIQRMQDLARLNQQMNQPIPNIHSHNSSPKTDYISGYGNVPLYELSENRFNQIWTNLQTDLSSTFDRLPERTYTVAGGGGGGTSGGSGGSGGGGGGGQSCGGHAWGSFDWAHCNMIRNWHSSSGGSGGYSKF